MHVRTRGALSDDANAACTSRNITCHTHRASMSWSLPTQFTWSHPIPYRYPSPINLVHQTVACRPKPSHYHLMSQLESKPHCQPAPIPIFRPIRHQRPPLLLLSKLRRICQLGPTLGAHHKYLFNIKTNFTGLIPFLPTTSGDPVLNNSTGMFRTLETFSTRHFRRSRLFHGHRRSMSRSRLIINGATKSIFRNLQHHRHHGHRTLWQKRLPMSCLSSADTTRLSYTHNTTIIAFHLSSDVLSSTYTDFYFHMAFLSGAQPHLSVVFP